ncbi:MAG: hypothetical protein FWC19_06460 [Treponema sp.]|nr:hypothetical protein [Treponema sp.]MCL2272426.1 hypothetical protein [Treponema sp.]
MSEVTYKTELSADGFEKIEIKIQNIENMANKGIFDEESRTSRFQQIVFETRQLRQVLRNVLLIVPAGGKGDAA